MECVKKTKTLSGHAVVFDIDDTMINSECGKVDPPIKLFWNMCGLLDLDRYIVTARPDEPKNRELAIAELEQNGITHWKALYMMPLSAYKKCQKATTNCDIRKIVGHYKLQARQHIITNSTNKTPLLLNIGDQWGDMTVNSVRFKGTQTGIHVGFFDNTSVLGVKLPDT